jgi:hypothetical protein
MNNEQRTRAASHVALAALMAMLAYSNLHLHPGPAVKTHSAKPAQGPAPRGLPGVRTNREILSLRVNGHILSLGMTWDEAIVVFNRVPAYRQGQKRIYKDWFVDTRSVAHGDYYYVFDRYDDGPYRLSSIKPVAHRRETRQLTMQA